jgi:hypothetical protein
MWSKTKRQAEYDESEQDRVQKTEILHASQTKPSGYTFDNSIILPLAAVFFAGESKSPVQQSKIPSASDQRKLMAQIQESESCSLKLKKQKKAGRVAHQALHIHCAAFTPCNMRMNITTVF